MSKPLTDSVTLSVVVPLYNESGNLAELVNRTRAVMDSLTLSTFEIILIDDGSRDNSGALIEQYHQEDPRIKLVSLSRNFGHAAALTAGIESASGDAVILMDADLQDRPEAIVDFHRAWKDGAQVVYAVRASRREPLLQRFLFRSFYRLLSALAGITIPLDAGIFCLLDRRVIEALKALPEHHRYFPGLRAFTGFRQVGVPVDRDARFSGVSSVGLMGQIRLAFNGIFSFSYLPLRLVTWLGLLVAGAAFAVMMNVLFKKWVSGEAILGWASTMTAILFIGGIQLITLGIVGEYVGRIYEETKRRPLYIIDKTLGIPSNAPREKLSEQ